jgi:hypothetical protein
MADAASAAAPATAEADGATIAASRPSDVTTPADMSAGTPSDEWSSPGDAGWKAAEAAVKPVAAGLTPKGLPKRVPRSTLRPGAAGGTGAAKATPPDIPARSAEAVRGRLSSFHQGLRQGRSASGGSSSTNRGDEHPEADRT